jgi:hypothetical protein
MGKLHRLLDAVRALYPKGEVAFRGASEVPGAGWICMVSVGDVILYESSEGSVEDVLDATSTAMAGIAERMQYALRVAD